MLFLFLFRGENGSVKQYFLDVTLLVYWRYNELFPQGQRE